ncbi:hypothetical protein EYF80_031256 [Liparis tanakae]|uniref:Uncharacterized protein n=1 Tax=Liparis tanakae TaxID=230148 RepID=A0A4Z2H120_9TELE|nr:hypothetical protein EYF80_031256 [Liparis tanakae]
MELRAGPGAVRPLNVSVDQGRVSAWRETTPNPPSPTCREGEKPIVPACTSSYDQHITPLLLETTGGC